MSELQEIRDEVRALREELHAVRNFINLEAQERKLIQRYLQGLSSTQHMTTREKRLSKWVPFWGWFHAWCVLMREPFSAWAAKEADILREEELSDAEAFDEMRKDFQSNVNYTIDDGEGGRKKVFPFRDK